MEIRCNSCNQKYVIPDDRLSDRPAYFTCEKCGEKIVVKGKAFRGFSAVAAGTATPGARDILEGIFLSFNLRNVLVSAFSLLGIFIILALGALAASSLADFFSEWPNLGRLLGAVLFFFCLLIFDMQLYLVAKNTAHRIVSGGTMSFFPVPTEIREDMKCVLLLSAGMPVLYLLLLVPIIITGSGWSLYAGFLLPVITVLSAAVFFFQLGKPIIFSHIALNPGSPAVRARSIFAFLGRENINIPLYMALTGIVATVMCGIMLFFIAGGVFLSAWVITWFSGNEAGHGLMQLLPAGASMFQSGLQPGIPGELKAGLVLMALMAGVMSFLAVGYYITLHQTLAVAAVSIMESNPGRSINRTAVLLLMILATAAFITTLLFIL
jgi:DNA-directed RNA polymerase subunit RPC12/RpoP